MFSTLAYVIDGITVIFAIIFLLAWRRPDHFQVSRTAAIAATPEKLFPLIANLRQMNTWNPFVLRDPASKINYTGPEAGKGAAHTFDGKRSGSGTIEVLEANAPTNVVMRLAMLKPIKADNRVEFTLKPNGGGTTDVTWTMGGKQPLLAKAMGLFFNSEKMVGQAFEEGLGNLKRMVERA